MLYRYGLVHNENWNQEIMFFAVIGIVPIIGLLFMLRDDSAGSFSFDKNGITLYTKKAQYHHAWTDFKYIEVVPLNVESVGRKNLADIYMIVFSTFYLTPQRKRDLMSKTTLTGRNAWKRPAARFYMASRNTRSIPKFVSLPDVIMVPSVM